MVGASSLSVIPQLNSPQETVDTISTFLAKLNPLPTPSATKYKYNEGRTDIITVSETPTEQFVKLFRQ